MSLRRGSWLWLWLWLVAALLLAPGAARSQQPEPRAEPDEISRSEWKSQVDNARQRSRQMRRDRQVLGPAEPDIRQQEEANSRRALEDGSLQIGDIVATNRGLFRFTGRSKDDPDKAYFVPLGSSLSAPDRVK